MVSIMNGTDVTSTITAISHDIRQLDSLRRYLQHDYNFTEARQCQRRLTGMVHMIVLQYPAAETVAMQQLDVWRRDLALAQVDACRHAVNFADVAPTKAYYEVMTDSCQQLIELVEQCYPELSLADVKDEELAKLQAEYQGIVSLRMAVQHYFDDARRSFGDLQLDVFTCMVSHDQADIDVRQISSRLNQALSLHE